MALVANVGAALANAKVRAIVAGVAVVPDLEGGLEGGREEDRRTWRR